MREGVARVRRDLPLLLFYGGVSVLVLALAVVAVAMWVQRQLLLQQIAAEPLPSVAIVTQDREAASVAAWVRLLSDAKIGTKVISPDEIPQDGESVLALCAIDTVSGAQLNAVEQHLARAGGVLILGPLARPLAERLRASASITTTHGMLQLASEASPVLARATPGHEIWFNGGEIALLDETPEMQIDARWRDSGRAAIAHYRARDGRVVWFGIDPGAMHRGRDDVVEIILRTAARWAAGQPVSDAASGDPAAAKALSPAARQAARRLSFSADRLKTRSQLMLRVTNRNGAAVDFVTVKVWLPDGAGRAKLQRPLFGRIDAAVEEADDGILVSMTRLAPHEERLVKLKLGNGGRS